MAALLTLILGFFVYTSGSQTFSDSGILLHQSQVSWHTKFLKKSSSLNLKVKQVLNKFHLKDYQKNQKNIQILSKDLKIWILCKMRLFKVLRFLKNSRHTWEIPTTLLSRGTTFENHWSRLFSRSLKILVSRISFKQVKLICKKVSRSMPIKAFKNDLNVKKKGFLRKSNKRSFTLTSLFSPSLQSKSKKYHISHSKAPWLSHNIDLCHTQSAKSLFLSSKPSPVSLIHSSNLICLVWAVVKHKLG